MIVLFEVIIVIDPLDFKQSDELMNVDFTIMYVFFFCRISSQYNIAWIFLVELFMIENSI